MVHLLQRFCFANFKSKVFSRFRTFRNYQNSKNWKVALPSITLRIVGATLQLLFFLSNIMPDSIFHESMTQGITCTVSFCLFVFSYLFVVCFFFLFFFCVVIRLFFLGWKRWNQFYHYKISGREEILNYNRLMRMGLISLQWDLKSEICQGISD